MTNPTFKYFGFNVTAEDHDEAGSIGVRINGTPMLHRVYAEGKRLEAAGIDGVPVEMMIRSDVEILQNARQNIETDPLGQRYYLRGELSRPHAYLIKTPDKPVERHGQYGGSLIEKSWRR